MYGVKDIGLVSLVPFSHQASSSHLDLNRVPYVMYGAKIDWPDIPWTLLDNEQYRDADKDKGQGKSNATKKRLGTISTRGRAQGNKGEC